MVSKVSLTLNENDGETWLKEQLDHVIISIPCDVTRCDKLPILDGSLVFPSSANISCSPKGHCSPAASDFTFTHLSLNSSIIHQSSSIHLTSIPSFPRPSCIV